MNTKYIVVILALFSFPKLDAQIWKEYVNDEFKISFPSNWSFDDSGINGTSAFISSELESVSDLFSENVNLIIQDLTGQNIGMEEYISLTKSQLSQLNAKHINIDKIENHSYGQESNLEYEFKHGIYNLRTKQRVIIANNKAYLATYTGTVSDFNKYLSTGDQILKSFKLSYAKTNSPIKSDYYENLKHKLTIKNLKGFEDINEGGNYILLHMGNLSDLNYRSYSLKYNDDWSFKLMTIEDYSKEVTEEQFTNSLKILYEGISINIFKRSYPKSFSEDVFHLVYSGIEIGTNDRMTVAIFQYIKNSKLYTLNCQCKSTYWQYYYNDCLDLLNSLKIE